MNVIIALIIIAVVIGTGNKIIRAVWNWFLVSETLEMYGIRTRRDCDRK